MNSTRSTLLIVGILFLLATAASIAAFVIIQTHIKGTDYLNTLYADRIPFSLGVLFQLICDVSVVIIGVLMFRIIKGNNENIAIGYLSSRIIEALIQVVGCISVLLLITISKEYIQDGTNNAFYYQTLGVLAKRWNGISFEISFFATGIGGVLLCYWLYKSKLIPPVITIIGFIGYTALFVKSLFSILGFSISMILFIPAAIFELIFPVWLIVKGSDTSLKIDTTITNARQME